MPDGDSQAQGLDFTVVTPVAIQGTFQKDFTTQTSTGWLICMLTCAH